MLTFEAFETLVSTRAWYKDLGITRVKALNYVYNFKKGKLSVDAMETLLRKAGFNVMQEKVWSAPYSVKRVPLESLSNSNSCYNSWHEVISPEFDEAYMVETMHGKAYLSLLKGDKETRIPFSKVEEVFSRAYALVGKDQHEFIEAYKKIIRDLIDPYKKTKPAVEAKIKPNRKIHYFEESDLVYAFQGF